MEPQMVGYQKDLLSSFRSISEILLFPSFISKSFSFPPSLPLTYISLVLTNSTLQLHTHYPTLLLYLESSGKGELVVRKSGNSLLPNFALTSLVPLKLSIGL